MSNLPNMIKSERYRIGLTQRELARKLDVSDSTIRAWESGERPLTVSSLLKMSDIFGCTTDYILGRSNERTVALYPKTTS